MSQSKILTDNTEQMVEICANLVKQGIVFEATVSSKGWEIVLSGGH